MARLPDSDDVKDPQIEDPKWCKDLNGEIDQNIKYMQGTTMQKLPTALQDNRIAAHPCEIPEHDHRNDENYIPREGDGKDVQHGSIYKKTVNVDTGSRIPKLNCTILCLIALSIISMTSVAVIMWNVIEAGRERDALKSRIGLIEKQLSLFDKVASKSSLHEGSVTFDTPTDQTITSTEANPGANTVEATSNTQKLTAPASTVSTSSKKDIATTTIQTTAMTTELETTTTTRTTPTATELETTSSISAPFAFQVLQTNNVTYEGYEFLALQVQLPSDGLSQSENWCRDYQYLCEHYYRRPTGCGKNFINVATLAECALDYNSDMNISSSVLECSPAHSIARIANTSFPTATTPATHNNAFGFYQCTSSSCKKTLEGSDSALTYTRSFWQDNHTAIAYTLCH